MNYIKFYVGMGIMLLAAPVGVLIGTEFNSWFVVGVLPVVICVLGLWLVTKSGD
jgi:hypothetical protein